jgi:hypothetical protein
MTKILVLYVFHEKNSRVDHFLKNCIFYDPNVDFIVICNNKYDTVVVPDFVKTIHRENIGYDFGGWSEALLTESTYKKYDHFVFVNSSVIGPFMKPQSKDTWVDMYIHALTDTIKLFGSTINTCKDPIKLSHVQSYIFSMNIETLEYLIACEIFSLTNIAKTFHEAIFKKEVAMSRKIIENGWNIGSFLSHYANVDFTFTKSQPHEYPIAFLDDIMFPQYRGILWNEYQLIFIKGNRCPNII